jgi:hypothetical protein
LGEFSKCGVLRSSRRFGVIAIAYDGPLARNPTPCP